MILEVKAFINVELKKYVVFWDLFKSTDYLVWINRNKYWWFKDWNGYKQTLEICLNTVTVSVWILQK